MVDALRDVGLRTFRAHFIAKLGNESTQFFELLGVGNVVDSIGKHFGLLALGLLANHFGHTAVGQEHKFLHELVGILCHLHVSGNGVSLLVHLEAHFRAFETDGAVFEACGTQLLGQLVEFDQLFCILALQRRSLRQRFWMFAWQSQIFFRGLVVSF